VKPTNAVIESRLEFIRTVQYERQDDAAETGIAAPLPLEIAPSFTLDAAGGKPAAGTGSNSGPEQRPRSTAELGIRRAFLEELALKTMFVSGSGSTRDLARHMRLSLNVADELFGRLKTEMLCQVTGISGTVPTISLTTQGRTRALEVLSLCQYTGAAPVTLERYVDQVRKQSVRNLVVRRPDVERAFSGMVVDPKILGQIGTALNSGASIFVHGPAGVGKTAMAETMSRVLAEDDVWIPHAIEVDGQVITVFDPLIHKQVEGYEEGAHDERWVRCHRPSVLVGGELTIEMLDLQFNAATRYYDGPMQMKANNGVLILDDFGRQRVSPEELLNRWIVPLDRGIDFLTMAGGKKIEVPFEMLVVFATNMDPAQLVDAAFLRRMQTKIRVESATDEQFSAIFRRVAGERGLEVEDGILTELISTIREKLHQQLRGCQPRDLVNQVCWAAQYEDRRPRLDRASLMRAVEAYFLADVR
jgi:predicted ATPase with chaperone activity